MKSIDIIIPCYNEEECIQMVYHEIQKALSPIGQDYSYSVIFVDDGSKDHTVDAVKELADRYGSDSVRFISFSRNFGKEAAIYAGLSYSTADYVALMDADLQHPPQLLPQMLEKIEEGYDCCGARRVSRKGEPKIRSFFARTFYRIINRLSGLNLVQGGSDYRMMTRQVVSTIVSMKEKERFTKGILSWVGFRTYWIDYKNVERAAGKTKWSFWELSHYAVNGFIGFATTPLRAAVWLGFTIDIITFIYAIYFAISILSSDGPRTGYGTIVLLLLFFGGTIILILGVIGEYLARIYLESKDRPIFILRETNIGQEGNTQKEKDDRSAEQINRKADSI